MLHQQLETGFIPSSRTVGSSLPPLFSLETVQYTPPSSLIYLTAANNLLFLAASPLSIIIINLNKPEELVTIDLPRPAPEKGSPNPQTKNSPVIRAIFIDPTARHLLVTTTSGDTFYLPISPGNAAVQSRRPRPLRLRQSITAVAWSPISGVGTGDQTSNNGEASASVKGDAITPPSTDVLLGTSTGQILSLPLPPQDDIFKSVSISMTKPLERDLQTVYTLTDGRPVTGISFGFWSSMSGVSGSKAGLAKKGSDKRAWVVITTKERLYEIQGNVSLTTAGGKAGGWAEETFRSVREGPPSKSRQHSLNLETKKPVIIEILELPGDPPSSELKVYIPTVDGQAASSLPPPSALAWLTGACGTDSFAS